MEKLGHPECWVMVIKTMDGEPVSDLKPWGLRTR